MTRETDKKNKKETEGGLGKPSQGSRSTRSAAPSKARHVGAILKDKRLEKKISLGDVVSDLRIQKDYITAIEASSYSDLPALTYACGFVKSYAMYLGFDGNEIVAKFKREAESLQVAPKDLPVPPILKIEDAVPTGKILGFSLLVLVVIYTLWSIFSTPSNVEMDEALALDEPVAELPDPGEVDAESGGNLGVSLSDRAEKTLSKVEQGLAVPVVIYAENDSWIEISDYQSKVLMSRILKEGEAYSLPNQTGLKLATGNAGEIEIRVGAKAIPKIGGVGVVKRNISIDKLIKDNL